MHYNASEGEKMNDQKTSHKRPFQELVPEEAVEHARSARKEMRKSVESLFPPGFIEHRQKARKEMLLAVRSVIDAALDRLEGKD